MLKNNTNVKIIEIYEELEKGRSIDLDFNEAKFTFTKEQPEPMVHARLVVQYQGVTFGEILVNDEMNGFVYQDFDEDYMQDISTLKQLYGLSNLMDWQWLVDME